ncbi:hypothetical protein ACFFUB_06670 [Algimonas porphyrae]|uniref:SPOR domain-containing protein n=1 Tax=Algimonas porphyrae TaxID=1128113 RepID=A0ABQ5V0S5_9PROT|nr:hypothetical protein [Algimonas porphyrae]GLQ21154.1 hypothetical protein GCM10007854_21090 [Algimonas porphyrae]
MTNYDNDKKVYHTEDTSRKSPMGWIIGGVALLALGAAVIYLTDVDLTQTAELPEVSVEGGQMPAIDVDVADVDLGSEEVTVSVPTIDITPPQEGEEADDLADNIDVDVDVDADLDVEMEPEQN